jgi:hypothetical protein
VSRAQSIGGQWLIVMQKAAEQMIRGWSQNTGEPIPHFVALAHHNALAGIDRYRNVRGIIVIGRTVPSPEILERIAGILTGFAVEPCGDWYPGKMITLKANDGSMVTVEHDAHPDPLTDALLQHICEDELMQIIGRGRGCNRTGADPLEIVIYGSTPVPVPVDELRVWSPLSLDEELLLREGVVLSSCSDMAEAFGLDPETIKKDRWRRKCQKGTNPYKRFLYGIVPFCECSAGELRAAIYRRDKPRHAEQRVVYDPRIVTDPKTWLISRLGRLVVFDPVPVTARSAVSADTPAPDLRHLKDQAKRERDRRRKLARRHVAGTVSRAEYLAQHCLSRTRPWESEGISRRTWERRRARETERGGSDASPSATTKAGSLSGPSQVGTAELAPDASPSTRTDWAFLRNFPTQSAGPPSGVVKTGISAPTIVTRPVQLDLFDEHGAVSEPLPEWNGGVAPPKIRQAIDRELRRRTARHRDLADAIGLSRSQVTNILRGRFGAAPAKADALKRLLGFWNSAA